jgi:hypothetical protein
VAAARAFLQGAGFRVTGVSANRLQINATGRVAQAERAFSTTISQYQLDKRTVFAPDHVPLLPDTLAANGTVNEGAEPRWTGTNPTRRAQA